LIRYVLKYNIIEMVKINSLIHKITVMKYLLILISIMIACNSQAQTRKKFNVGDSAFCGVIFWVEKTDTSGGQRALVCSVKDQSAATTWNNGSFVVTSATNDILFDRLNSEKIIQSQGNGKYAAILCRDMPANDGLCNITDTLWYLPSLAELKLIYQVLDSTKRMTFVKEGYWSSIEKNTRSTGKKTTERKAWIVDFFSGKSFAVLKSNKYHIRAIREIRN